MIIDPPGVKKILVIKLRAIGDVLLSTVVLKNLRAKYPEAQIDFLTEGLSREVVEGNPCLDSVLVFNKKESGIGLILRVRNQGYDLVLDLFGNPRSALVTYFSGARYRVGYRLKWRQYCYNIVVEPRGGEIHNTEFNLDALRPIAVRIVDTVPQFPISSEAEEFAEQFFTEAGLEPGRVVALNPGGGWYTKRWRIPQLARLGDRIAEEYGFQILFIWGPGEQHDAGQLQSMMKSPAILIPPTSLKQLAAILKRCSIVVTNDSGPMHIAAAVGTPVVAIFGPTNPELQGPVGESHEVVKNQKLVCLGCNYTSCPIENPCMEELSVEEVFAGVQRLVDRNKIPFFLKEGHKSEW